MTWSEAAFALALAVLTVGGLLVRRAVMGLNQPANCDPHDSRTTPPIVIHSDIDELPQP